MVADASCKPLNAHSEILYSLLRREVSHLDGGGTVENVLSCSSPAHLHLVFRGKERINRNFDLRPLLCEIRTRPRPEITSLPFDVASVGPTFESEGRDRHLKAPQSPNYPRALVLLPPCNGGQIARFCSTSLGFYVSDLGDGF
ncbi:hypothetical protein MRB53_009477 [Persea americana]|uniref:Uncharacterized protein n=1 Tax=Persea americana TaxID=3435 RepID=A0ACC2LPH1_PERAE|nr:hypothetical protein MRB53_009477 [Persea americana]